MALITIMSSDDAKTKQAADATQQAADATQQDKTGSNVTPGHTRILVEAAAWPAVVALSLVASVLLPPLAGPDLRMWPFCDNRTHSSGVHCCARARTPV